METSRALTAGELVREAVGHVRAQADLLEELGHLVLELGARGEPVHLQRLPDGVADGDARVQGGIGVLENHLHFAAVRQHLV
jgi:hypothetical protein